VESGFYDRPVLAVARDLIGCTVTHAGASGAIVETEAYHAIEPACHAHVGLTARTRPLFGPPGRAYVYRSYGIHALLNAVSEAEGVGAAVLIPLSEATRIYLGGTGKAVDLMIYGALIVLVSVFRPAGLMGLVSGGRGGDGAGAAAAPQGTG